LIIFTHTDHPEASFLKPVPLISYPTCLFGAAWGIIFGVEVDQAGAVKGATGDDRTVFGKRKFGDLTACGQRVGPRVGLKVGFGHKAA
jgi:hypothetical protein